jgi:hypothetical protein
MFEEMQRAKRHQALGHRHIDDVMDVPKNQMQVGPGQSEWLLTACPDARYNALIVQCLLSTWPNLLRGCAIA